MLLEQPVTIPVFDRRPDIRLVVADMDGTLLNEDKKVHPQFWPLVDELHRRGVVFCPASGRQYYTLLDEFADIADEMVFIAENGAYVVRSGVEISSDCLSRDDAHRLITALRDTIAGGADAGVVVCGKKSAYIERSDPAFLAGVVPYYRRLELVDDLHDVIDGDDVLKLAVFDLESSERIEPFLQPFSDHASGHCVGRALAGHHLADRQQGQLRSNVCRTLSASPQFADHGVRRLPQRPGDDGHRGLLVRDGQRPSAAAVTRRLRCPGQHRQRRRPDDRLGARHSIALN